MGQHFTTPAGPKSVTQAAQESPSHSTWARLQTPASVSADPSPRSLEDALDRQRQQKNIIRIFFLKLEKFQKPFKQMSCFDVDSFSLLASISIIACTVSSRGAPKGQADFGFESQGGPSHHKEKFANSRGVRPRVAQSAELSAVLTWLQQAPGSNV
ncbi:hypothetical protein TKK_0011535 [Trichogramma kaykai]